MNRQTPTTAMTTPAWQSKGILLSPGSGFDDVAVKDPTIVQADGAWHLFYTAIGKRGGGVRRSLGYVTAPRLEDLQTSARMELSPAWPADRPEIAAPQVFYCRTLAKWVLVAQRPEPGPTRYVPIVSFSKDIRDPGAWSAPRDLVTVNQLPPGQTAIDFWIISDGESYWLFFSDQKHGIWAMQSPDLISAEKYSAPQRVLVDQGTDWELHEAAHIYFLPALNRYRLYVEAFRYGGSHRNHLERFIAIYHADHLPGPWRRDFDEATPHTLGPEGIAGPDGQVPGVHQVSHPEWIRRGIDERLEIDPAPGAIIQETAVESPADDYLHLGWRLRLVQPFEARSDNWQNNR